MRKTFADPAVRELAQQCWSLEDQLDGAEEGSDVAELERLLNEHRGQLSEAMTKQDEGMAKHHPKIRAVMAAAEAETAKSRAAAKAVESDKTNG